MKSKVLRVDPAHINYKKAIENISLWDNGKPILYPELLKRLKEQDAILEKRLNNRQRKKEKNAKNDQYQ